MSGKLQYLLVFVVVVALAAGYLLVFLKGQVAQMISRQTRMPPVLLSSTVPESRVTETEVVASGKIQSDKENSLTHAFRLVKDANSTWTIKEMKVTEET